jgi:hypothetical protein
MATIGSLAARISVSAHPGSRASGRLRHAGMLAALLLAGYDVSLMLQSSAQTIRDELTSAAAEVRALPWNRSPEAVRQAIGQHFPGRPVIVDATQFPVQVAVMLTGLDQPTCRAAASLTRRIEGAVVVALDGFRSESECTAGNDMRWRIMP